MSHKENELSPDVESETIVVTTEQGVVLTGSRAQAFEARIMHSIRRPMITLRFLMGILFVVLIGIAVLVSNLAGHVNSADTILKTVTGSSAQAAQQKSVDSIVKKLNCQNQFNLQSLVDQAIANGQKQFIGINVVQPECKP